MVFEAVNHIIAEHLNKKISLLNRLKDGKHQSMPYPYSSSKLSNKTSINIVMKQHRRLPSEAKVDSPFAKIQKTRNVCYSREVSIEDFVSL